MRRIKTIISFSKKFPDLRPPPVRKTFLLKKVMDMGVTCLPPFKDFPPENMSTNRAKIGWVCLPKNICPLVKKERN